MPTTNEKLLTHRHQAILWLIALTLISLGLYLSHIRYLGMEWLSRAGCTIVMLGIFWSGLGGIIQERVLSGRLQWRRRIELARTRRNLVAQRVEQEVLEKEIEKIEKAYAEIFAKLSHELRLSLGILEVSLLITGTFLWGFGDLFYAG